MTNQERSAVSIVLATAIAILIVGGAVVGIFLVNMQFATYNSGDSPTTASTLQTSTSGSAISSVSSVSSTTNTSTNYIQCWTSNDSISCATMVSGSITTGSSCEILPLGKGLYIHFLNDAGQPLSDAQATIYFASPFCPNVTVDETEQLLRTNASGWTNYDLNGAGRYDFTVTYSSEQYNFNVSEKTGQTTYATVMLPSGNLSVKYSGAVSLYSVTFHEFPCAGYIVSPWSVTLGTGTIVDPENGTLSSNGVVELVPAVPSLENITFNVSPGQYAYSISPATGFQYQAITSGSVNVTSSNVTILLQAECHP